MATPRRRPAEDWEHEPEPAATGPHLWRAKFNLGDHGSAQVLVRTATRDGGFAEAEKAALAHAAREGTCWPTPAELVAIEYLGEI